MCTITHVVVGENVIPLDEITITKKQHIRLEDAAYPYWIEWGDNAIQVGQDLVDELRLQLRALGKIIEINSTTIR